MKAVLSLKRAVLEEIERLFTSNGFVCQQRDYLYKKPTNVKERIEVDRVFIQGRFIVPTEAVPSE